ncbi:MAG: hypothetical protein P8Y34_11320, partial [Anaerolineales bacterium]
FPWRSIPRCPHRTGTAEALAKASREDFSPDEHDARVSLDQLGEPDLSRAWSREARPYGSFPARQGAVDNWLIDQPADALKPKTHLKVGLGLGRPWTHPGLK